VNNMSRTRFVNGRTIVIDATGYSHSEIDKVCKLTK
jgi:hypothetical protein